MATQLWAAPRRQRLIRWGGRNEGRSYGFEFAPAPRRRKRSKGDGAAISRPARLRPAPPPRPPPVPLRPAPPLRPPGLLPPASRLYYCHSSHLPWRGRSPSLRGSSATKSPARAGAWGAGSAQAARAAGLSAAPPPRRPSSSSSSLSSEER